MTLREGRKRMKRSFLLGLFLVSMLCIAMSLYLCRQTAALQVQNQELQNEIAAAQESLEKSIEKRQNVPATNLMMLDPFMKQVDHDLAVQKPGKVAAFIALDGDHIGKANLIYGAGTGTAIVKALAQCLKESFPDKENDILCNVGPGSDEFYLLLKNRDSSAEIEQQVQAFMEKFRAAEVTSHGVKVKGTCSAGIVLAPAEGTEFLTLYKKADKALYHAKENGRDRFAFYAQEKGCCI